MMRALPFWAVFAACAAAPLVGEFGILVALAAGALLLGARLGGAREIPLWKPVALMLAPLAGWVVLALIGL